MVESLRRLLLAVIWIFYIFLAVIFIKSEGIEYLFVKHDRDVIYATIGVTCSAVGLHVVVNWIFQKGIFGNDD